MSVAGPESGHPAGVLTLARWIASLSVLQPERPSWNGRRVVGCCSVCAGEVVYDPEAREAACDVGCSVVPRSFLEPIVRPT